jgi:hypothetical protein
MVQSTQYSYLSFTEQIVRSSTSSRGTYVNHNEGGVTVAFIAVLRILRGIISKKKSIEPDEGESIVRARSRYNALLFHAHVACPDHEPLICIPSTRYERVEPRRARASKAVKCRQVRWPCTAYAWLLFFFSSRPALLRSRIFSRSLSSLSLVTTTLEGARGMGTD